MPKPTPPELFAERPVRSDFAQKKGIPYAVRRKITLAVLAFILIGGGAGLYALRKPSEPAVIPTIKADTSFKQRPAEPGGIDIPHQDVEVYQALDSNHVNDKPEVEHLMPMPETPQAANMPAPVPTTPAPTGAITVPIGNILAPQQAPKIPTTVSPSVSETASPPAVSAPVTQPVAETAPSQPEKPAPINETPKPAEQSQPVPAPIVPAHTEAKTVSANGDASIQLASVPDQQAAQQMLAKLKNKYKVQLGPVSLRLVRADLGAKGIYYRIQSQPVSLAEANHLCAMIKKTNAGCILVRH